MSMARFVTLSDKNTNNLFIKRKHLKREKATKYAISVFHRYCLIHVVYLVAYRAVIITHRFYTFCLI